MFGCEIVGLTWFQRSVQQIQNSKQQPACISADWLCTSQDFSEGIMGPTTLMFVASSPGAPWWGLFFASFGRFDWVKFWAPRKIRKRLAHRSLKAGSTIVSYTLCVYSLPKHSWQLFAVSRQYKASIFQPAVWDSMSQVCKFNACDLPSCLCACLFYCNIDCLRRVSDELDCHMIAVCFSLNL